ncbi:hypothetical protein ACP275_13G163000 [Erythranthe tilingii]
MFNYQDFMTDFESTNDATYNYNLVLRILIVILGVSAKNIIFMEGNDQILNGWPLGLIGELIMNSSSHQLVVVPPPPSPPQPCNSGLHRRSSSFSSLSSSNIDTESTASFYPDQSVTLGRLIGIEPVSKGISYCKRHEPDLIRSSNNSLEIGFTKGHTDNNNNNNNNSQGICVPLLHSVIWKMGRTGSSSTH